MGWSKPTHFNYFTFSVGFVGKSPPPPTGATTDVESTTTAVVSTSVLVESFTSFVADPEPQAVNTKEVETAKIKKYFFILLNIQKNIVNKKPQRVVGVLGLSVGSTPLTYEKNEKVIDKENL
jgi:hypothetical protein